MKIDKIKTLFAIAIALLFGFICEIIAPTTGGRNWISLAISSLTCLAGLLPALGLSFTNERRGVSIKLVAWILTLALLAANIVFSGFEYRIDIYIALTLLLALSGWVVIYALFRAPK